MTGKNITLVASSNEPRERAIGLEGGREVAVCLLQDRVSPCCPVCPGIYYEDQCGHELIEISVCLLRLKACATMLCLVTGL